MENQPQHSEAPKRHHHKTSNSNFITLFVIVVVLVGLSFFAGTKYEKAHDKTSSTAFNSSSRASGQGGFRGGFGGQRGNAVFGSVTAISSTSITIDQTRTNSSTTLAINSSTVITDNGQTESVSDVQTGDTVVAMKSSSSSTTASRIDVNPSFGSGPTQQQSSSGSSTGSATVN